MENRKDTDARRLVKNTIALYLRTAVTMVVSLIVTRVLLKELGGDDYGIYNVVASVVVLFSFLNASMSQAIQRFITYFLGTGDIEKTRAVFSVSLLSQSIIVLVLILICEIAGVWFINYKMAIPPDRLYSANLAFQFSVLTFCLNFIRVPYESSIIAYEKMFFFAYASILDAFLKFLIAYGLYYSQGDKLIIYSIMLSVESVIMLILYGVYCNHKFRVCNFKLSWDKSLFKDIITFSGWNVFGSMANIFGQKGVVILLNIFVGLIANAAMGITNQVYAALNSFINSFQTSFRPQIVKAYAAGEITHMLNIVSSTSKFSFILIYIPAIILIVNMPTILRIWLTEVPEYTVQFCRLITVCCIIDAISGPYNCAIMATGKIRNYQFWLSISCIFDVIFCYAILKAGISANYVLLSRIATRGLFNLLIGLYYLKALLTFNIIKYLRTVIFPILLFLLSQLPILYVIYCNFSDWTLLSVSSIITMSLGMLGAAYILLNSPERHYLKSFISKR